MCDAEATKDLKHEDANMTIGSMRSGGLSPRSHDSQEAWSTGAACLL